MTGLGAQSAEGADVRASVERLRDYARNGRLAFTPGTPEKYPRAAVAVRLLDLEAALFERDQLQEALDEAYKAIGRLVTGDAFGTDVTDTLTTVRDALGLGKVGS